MKNKTIFLHIPVLLSAALALIQLSGIAGNAHLTTTRIFYLILVFIGCLFWLVLYKKCGNICRKKGYRAFLFQLCLFLSLLSIVLIPIGKRLMIKEGIAYTAGAVIHQGESFLVFFAVQNLCSALLLVFTLRKYETYPLRILLSESHIIPEFIFIFLACLLVFGAFIPLRANYYPSHDYAIFAYIGQQILRGKMPYTELWDHKPPLIFYLNALGLQLTGGSLLGIWLLEFAAFFTGALILLRLLKRRFPEWISLPVLLLGLLHYVRVLDFGNYTEEASLFFVLCALGLRFTVYPISGYTALSGFINGFLCGMAFTSKQNTIGCWAALFLLDTLRFLPRGNNNEAFKRYIHYWLYSALGFLSLNAVWVIYFAKNNALSAYWDVAFRFNFIYSDKSTESRLACAWTTLTFLPSVSFYLLTGFLSWIPVCVNCFKVGIRNFIDKNDLTAWALIALPAELILAGLSGMNYQHYFILCITPVIILLCSFIDKITRRIAYRKWLFQTGIIIGLCAASLPIATFFSDNYMPRTPSSYTKTRDYLLGETTPDEPILVWGSRSAIYVMSGRYAPTAYFNERPLYLFPDEIQSAQWDELLSDIQTDPPQVIIYTHDTALPFIELTGSSCKIPAGAEYKTAVYQYFCDNYHYETTINPEFYDAWDIFRRNENTPEY